MELWWKSIVTGVTSGREQRGAPMAVCYGDEGFSIDSQWSSVSSADSYIQQGEQQRLTLWKAAQWTGQCRGPRVLYTCIHNVVVYHSFY